MTDRPDDHLDAVLRSVGLHLDVPDHHPVDIDALSAVRPAAVADGSPPGPATPGPASGAVSGPASGAGRRGPGADRSGRWRRVLAVAAVLAVAVAAVVLVPPARSAVADLLGIGSTRISEVGDGADPGDLPDLPHVARSLTAITAREAADRLGWEPPDTSATSLGPPDRILRMSEGGVLLAWSDRSATLWLRDADDTDILIYKAVASVDDLEPVEDLGTEALVVRGSHILDTPGRRVAAGTVLLWVEDGHELRLEADMATPELVEVARALRWPG